MKSGSRSHIVTFLISLLLINHHNNGGAITCFQTSISYGEQYSRRMRIKYYYHDLRPTNIRERKLWLSNINNDNNHSLDEDNYDDISFNEKEQQGPSIYSLAMVGMPFCSIILSQLLQMAKSLPPNSSEQLAVVTTLFVTNRIYLYILSVTIVALAALRGAADSPKLGKRITDLTEELLYRPSLSTAEKMTLVETSADSSTNIKPSMIKSLNESGFSDSLDQVSTDTQALALPILVSLLLASSVFLLPVWNHGPSIDQQSSFSSIMQELLSDILPKLSQVWTYGLLTLFTRSEVRRLLNEFQREGDSGNENSMIIIAEWLVSFGITSSAFFLQLWPAQNFVNMALAVLVARVIQLDKFPAIVAALCLLTIYDATSVFLLPAANAIEPSSAAAGSAMGSVAAQKLSSGTFQPGLLTTKIGSSLGGSLGLGDAVFPSILANFARRFDLQRQPEDKAQISLFIVSIGGYLLGCFACEFAPMISSSGIPALIFITPSMLGSVLIASVASRELKYLFQFDPSKGK